MNLFFGIFLILTLFLPLSGMENKWGRGGKSIMLLPPASASGELEKVRTAKFVARVRDFAASLGKGRRHTLPCRIRMQKGLGCVQIKWDGRSAGILIEEDFSILSSRKEDLHLLTGWLLLVENGLSPHEVKNREFYTSFLVSGVARRAFMDVERRSFPYPDYFPCARTLASRGIFPTLERSLENPGERAWSSCMSLYSEYCELIFLAMLRSRGLEKTSFTRILEALALSPAKSQKAHFFDLLRMEKKKKKRKEPLPREEKIPPEALESWYASFLEKALLSPMQPLALEEWEKRYREILSFPAEDLPGNPGRALPSSPHFPEVFKKMKDLDKVLFKTLNSLLHLGNISPVSLREELHHIRRALLRYRKGGLQKKDLDALLSAEKRLFSVLEKEYALQEFLMETERDSFPPTLRFQRSLHASRSWEAKEKQNMGRRFATLFAGAQEALEGRKEGNL